MSAPHIRVLDYEAFIASAAWRESPARLRELELSGYRCRVCAGEPPDVILEVHHNSYGNFGAERVEDLCTLCSGCHRDVTASLRRRRYEGAALPAATDTPRALAGRDIAEPAWEVPHG